MFYLLYFISQSISLFSRCIILYIKEPVRSVEDACHYITDGSHEVSPAVALEVRGSKVYGRVGILEKDGYLLT